MKRFVARLLLPGLLFGLLTGCSGKRTYYHDVTVPPAPTEQETAPLPTAPPADPEGVAARLGELTLTNGELTLYCAMVLGSLEPGEPEPEREALIQRALTLWHTRQALVKQSRTATVALDPEFQPVELHHKNLAPDLPVMEVLYGARTEYAPDELLQNWIDGLEERIAPLAGEVSGDLYGYARDMNLAYAYYVSLERELSLTQEELTRCAALGGEPLVTFRHILLPNEAENPWTGGEEWDFALLASRASADDGTARAGGLYHSVSRGQLMRELEDWLFDPGRQPGDTTSLETELGVHLLYFSCVEGADCERARQELLDGKREAILAAAREEYPMEVDWSTLGLSELARPPFGDGELLYPDIAHERYHRPPVFLQQDFPNVWYNGISLAKSGCGLTTMAMLASYMTDTFLTPPEIVRRYARAYTIPSGTDARLFEDIPQTLGFYWERKTYDMEEVYQALKDGYLVLHLQHKGYFTRDGHYMLLLGIDEEDRVPICDSNIFNYARLKEHKENRFPFAEFLNHSMVSIIFQPKVTRLPACRRCGGETGLSAPEGLLLQAYTCPGCREAMARREAFLETVTLPKPQE